MERPSKSERKSKVRSWRDGERAKARSLFPLSDAGLERFFSDLEALRAEHGCFHDIRHSLHVIRSMGLSEAATDALLDWCNEHGGFCDCEIAGNTHEYWQTNRGRA
jgi:hypothetical protein